MSDKELKKLVEFCETSTYIDKNKKQVVLESLCWNKKNDHAVICKCGKCFPYAVHGIWKYKDSVTGK